jgi:hypothetical protein
MKNYSHHTNKKVTRYRTPSPFRAMSGENAKRAKASFAKTYTSNYSPSSPRLP